MNKVLLSVVLPSYNEEKNIPLIYKELLKYIDTKSLSYELLFVNDGSKDGTWSQIKKISGKDPNVKGINFSRNFGHHAALEAGLKEAKGDIVIMMDSDLQHPPSLIPKLVEKWLQGFDVVNTVRLTTEDSSFMKNITSKVFYKILNNLSDLDLKDGEADYRLISRRALDSLNALPETPKFYRGLINWIGYDVCRVEYSAQARQHGKSSYTFKKMIELARLGLTSFSMKPLKLIIITGVLLVLGAFFSLIAMLVIKFGFSPNYFSNNAILVMFLVLITGVLTTFQGIVAVYLVDIFNAAKGRPSYIIREITSEDKEA
jgi:dolichol-phosphate mannosyltransferase